MTLLANAGIALQWVVAVHAVADPLTAEALEREAASSWSPATRSLTRATGSTCWTPFAPRWSAGCRPAHWPKPRPW
jgi:hypothetical protein